MPLYEYPPKLDRQSRQLKAVHDIEQHQKMKKNMHKSVGVGVLLIMISFVIPIVLVKVFVILIGIGNIIIAFLLYKYSAYSRETDCYTRIYEDKIEHCQSNVLTNCKTSMIVYYDDIVKSYQNPKGKLIVFLKDGYRSQISSDKNNKNAQKDLRKNMIALDFQDVGAKLYLIDNFHEEIKYPKKQYNIIEDEEDEDDEWDPLHKHGL